MSCFDEANKLVSHQRRVKNTSILISVYFYTQPVEPHVHTCSIVALENFRQLRQFAMRFSGEFPFIFFLDLKVAASSWQGFSRKRSTVFSNTDRPFGPFSKGNLVMARGKARRRRAE